MTSHSGPPCNLPAPPLLCHAQDFEAIPQDFDLPTLGPVLRAMRQDVQHGRGFALLRGLPVDRWTRVQVSSTRMAGPAWVLALAESCRGLNLPTQELASSDHGLPDIAGWWQPYSNWFPPPCPHWFPQSLVAYWIIGLHWGRMQHQASAAFAWTARKPQ